MAAAPIQHRRDMGDFEYGRVDQLSPLVRRVICKNPNPFTYKGTATFLVGHGDVAVIDPGPTYGVHQDAVLAALGPDERVSHILITHTHSDHSTAASAIKERTGARIYGFGPHGTVRPTDPEDKVDFSAYFTAEEKARYDKEYDDLPEELKRGGRTSSSSLRSGSRTPTSSGAGTGRSRPSGRRATAPTTCATSSRRSARCSPATT
jgi:hypothetical protein